MTGRRLLVLLISLGLLAVPAGALRAACAGRSCAELASPARVPFCPLPGWLKEDIAAGYREDRSPDVIAVADRADASMSDTSSAAVPSVADGPSITNVPIIFWGRGVDAAADVPAGTTLDTIAPTIADAIGLRRRHPRVRSGVAVPGVSNGERPTLVVEIALAGIGTRDVRADPGAWRSLRHLMKTGAGTKTGDTGSLPLDPAATLTTIGTGGLPYQHGITGALIRGDDGRVVAPWSAGAPPSVIATLADDLDMSTKNAARIGLIAPTATDRGLIGGTWYDNGDRDDVIVPASGRPTDVVGSVASLLSRGYGSDAVPDVLGVVLRGRSLEIDRQLRRVVAESIAATKGQTMVVVAGTGTATGVHAIFSEAVRQVDDDVSGDAPIVSGATAGGLFLDQRVMTQERVSGQTVVDALSARTDTDGGPLFRDAFQGFAVSFAGYCP